MELIKKDGRIVRKVENAKDVLAHGSAVLKKDISAFHNQPKTDVENGIYIQYDIGLLRITPIIKRDHRLFIKGQLTFLTRQPNRESPFLEDFMVENELVGGYRHRRFSYALLCLQLMETKVEKGAKGDPAAAREKVVGLLDASPIWVCNGHYLIQIKEGHYLDLLTGKGGSEADFGIDLKAAAYQYGGEGHCAAISSNGMIKKCEVILPCTNMPGFDFREVLNELTMGLLDIVDKAGRVAGKIKQVAQLSTRLAQVEAPQVEGEYLKCGAFYMGIHSPLWDGSAYVSSSFLASWVEERLGDRYAVPPEAVLSMAVQCRPWMAKVNASCVAPSYMACTLQFPGWPVAVIPCDEATEEGQDAFNQAVWSKGKDGILAGALVIIIPSLKWAEDHDIEMVCLSESESIWTVAGKDLWRLFEEVQFFTDLNGLKETFGLHKKTGLNVLHFEEPSAEQSLSSQTAVTFAVSDFDKTESLVKSLAQEARQKMTDSLLAQEGSAVRSSALLDHPNYARVLEQVAPRFISECWRPAYKRAVEHGLMTLNTKFGGEGSFGLTYKGAYCVFTVDPSLDFDMNLLNVSGNKVEVVCRDLKPGQEGMLVRFPKANAYAFSVVKAISVDQYMTRAARQIYQKLDNRYMACKILLALRERMKHLPKGVVVLPASQDLMDKHDGHDYDGDHGQIVTDERVLNIVKNKLNVIVHITDDETVTKMQEEAKEAKMPETVTPMELQERQFKDLKA